jgi:glutathione peroxidase
VNRASRSRLKEKRDDPRHRHRFDRRHAARFAGAAWPGTVGVNVASECGLTPQYEGLERLARQYRDRGLTVVGVPCNQFGEQEPGSAGEITAFCSSSYDVTFPLTEKVDVNGPRRHPLYAELTRVEDESGESGDVQWNFEKFLVDRAGKVVARFRPMTLPESEEIVTAIETALAPR